VCYYLFTSIVEVGGESKSFKQIKDLPCSYLVVDTDFTENKNKIPPLAFCIE